MISLKPVLKRGALVAAANWQVTLVQATADSLFKLLIATPILGGVFLVALVAGTEPGELMTLEWREMAATIVGSLRSHPLVLIAFLLAVGVVAVGGSLCVFLVKAGTVATLVRGERQAGNIEEPPLHLESLRQGAAFSAERYIDASRALFPRYARLGLILMVVYLASGAAYLAALFAIGLTGDTWGLAALVTVSFVIWITVVNWLYLLVQIVIAADDCSVAAASARVATFIRRERRAVGTVFLVILGLVVAATGVSWLATAALWLIGFVPFIGLALIPIQLMAWLFRGIVFQYLGLSSVGAYVRLYREQT
jgi:hypothetical protein